MANMRTIDSLTIYNKFIDPVTRLEKYQRAEIEDCYWEDRKAINRSKVGAIANDSAMVVIPMVQGANYLKPVAWQALVSKTGKWTLQTGDVMVKGAITDEISSSFTITALTKKYNDVITITSVDTFDSGSTRLQHWEISAK